MWYGAHDDLQEEIFETRFLLLEVEFLAALQGFFSHPILPCTSLRIPWEEPDVGRSSTRAGEPEDSFNNGAMWMAETGSTTSTWCR
jgi:hypothetical protein